jgi:hypothetical protein
MAMVVFLAVGTWQWIGQKPVSLRPRKKEITNLLADSQWG